MYKRAVLAGDFVVRLAKEAAQHSMAWQGLCLSRVGLCRASMPIVLFASGGFYLFGLKNKGPTLKRIKIRG